MRKWRLGFLFSIGGVLNSIFGYQFIIENYLHGNWNRVGAGRAGGGEGEGGRARGSVAWRPGPGQRNVFPGKCGKVIHTMIFFWVFGGGLGEQGYNNWRRQSSISNDPVHAKRINIL